MTGATNFIIDGTLASADADSVLANLKKWLTSDPAGLLDISPLPVLPQLPTQVALQLLLTAAAELARQGSYESRISPDAMALCSGLSGGGSHADLAKPLTLETENG